MLCRQLPRLSPAAPNTPAQCPITPAQHCAREFARVSARQPGRAPPQSLHATDDPLPWRDPARVPRAGAPPALRARRTPRQNARSRACHARALRTRAATRPPVPFLPFWFQCGVQGEATATAGLPEALRMRGRRLGGVLRRFWVVPDLKIGFRPLSIYTSESDKTCAWNRVF